MSQKTKATIKKSTLLSITSSLIICIAITTFSLLTISLFPPKISLQQTKQAQAAGEIPIYRSVGPLATGELEIGTTNNLTISGSVAIFASDIDTDVGVGDALQYDSNADGVINAIVFIYGRTDAKNYTVKTVTGGDVADMGTADNDWKIFRAYISLSNAENGIENTGIHTDVRNFDDWTGGGTAADSDLGKDIVASNEQWNIACYANGSTADETAVAIEG